MFKNHFKLIPCKRIIFLSPKHTHEQGNVKSQTPNRVSRSYDSLIKRVLDSTRNLNFHEGVKAIRKHYKHALCSAKFHYMKCIRTMLVYFCIKRNHIVETT